jgi:uncharacterized protein YndB with AHSA1/START domain
VTPESDEVVVIRRRISATRENVFAAWLDSDGMAVWMCPELLASTEVQLDAQVGGEFRILMRSETEAFEHRGEFLIVEPPSKLAFIWRAKATDFAPTLVTVELFETPDGDCDLVLRHEKILRPDIREQYRGGWRQILTRLEAFLQARR